MKKIIILASVFGFLVFSSVFASNDDADINNNHNKKKILIFVIKGGGGHVSAANAISEILSDTYDNKIINPFTDSEIFGDADFVKKLSFGIVNCEDFYNFLLRNRWNWCINRLSDIGSYWISSHQKRLSKKIIKYLTKEKPDMIISVIPFLNGIILNACQELKIPFLSIPTDLNAETFALGIGNKKYDNFVFSLAFNDRLIMNKIKPFHLHKDNIKYIGYPLRKDFFEKKDREKIKQEFNIPKNKHIVMILMGAEGSNAIYSYVYHLTKSKMPMHLIICIGRNEGLRPKLDKIKFPKYITKTVFGFTNRVSDLMAISDLFITKPGSHSVCEAIQIGVPILIDQTLTSLQWERLNGDFIKKYGIGNVVRNYRKVNKLVRKFLRDEKFKIELNKNTQKLKRESLKIPLCDVVKQMFDSIENKVVF